ncbi:ATP-binding protein [uncultured Bacteroides sp.]|uniref:sensor histidine kinase n=1 Tax=uncultured Bacteroides sp. TaxID=162156 RepID=UPI003749068B
MKHFYAEDLDELIEYRSDEFIKNQLPTYTLADINYWNKYNEDMQIMPFNASYPLNSVVQKPFYNGAEEHKVDYRIYYTKINIEKRPFILMSRIAMIETDDLIQMLAYQYGILSLMLILSLVVVQQLISKKLWKPFYDSLDKIENFNLEQGVIPNFKETTTTEFSRLNENLDKLIKNDLNTYAQQKEFIENASHELQTPLAVFQSQLDLLLQNPDLTKEQVAVIQSLYSVSSRLTRLNKNLLLLAKIDNSQFKEQQKIDFNETLNTQLLYLKDLAENDGIHVSIEISNPIVIMANKTLLESLINNLIVNAIRHNIPNGIISISVKNNVFTVSNTGEETSLDKERIFKRFSRTSEKRKGNGLGLSITYQICKLHGWEIEYDYQNEQHSFSVSF